MDSDKQLITLSPGELVIRVASQDGAEVFGDDSLEDILVDTGKVFWIGKPQVSTISLHKLRSHTQSVEQYEIKNPTDSKPHSSFKLQRKSLILVLHTSIQQFCIDRMIDAIFD